MRLQHILFCLLICWPVPLSAKSITVRSGEHPSFSRLVVYTSLSDKPTLTRTDDGFRLSTGDTEDRFRISGVFEKIPRARIANLTSIGAGVLDIILNCACEAKTQTLPEGQFVIDIIDQPDPHEPPATRSRQSGPDIAARDSRTSSQDARRGLPIAGASFAGVPPDLVEPTIQVGTDDPTSSKPLPTRPSALTENSLREQLARAAAQGLVDAPSFPDTSIPKTGEIAAIPTHPPVANEHAKPIAAPPPTSSHMRIQTSVDRDLDRSTASSPAPDTDAPCLPAQSFAIANWGTDDQETLDFATYRASLTTELDKLNTETFRSFIQHQIFLTLGTEALSYLKKYPGALQTAEDLQLMAEVIASGSAAGYARMTTQLACDGPVALWAVLSHPRLPRDHSINTAVVISEFSVLPRHLRIHLGPMVMRKFLAIGDTDTAIEINRISQRGIETHRTDNTLADAQLLLETGSSREGRDQLINIVENDDQNAVDAILLLIENHIETQTGIPDRTLELLSSLAHEHKATAMGVDLAVAEIRGLIHVARLTDARANMRDLDPFPDRENDRHLQILNEFGMALSRSAANGAFLRNIIGQPMWADADEATRMSVADRLLSLGFVTEAKHLLTNQPAPPGRAARVLIAKAALREGQAGVALGYLSGLNDPESQKLRETALLATKQETAPTVPGSHRTESVDYVPATEISLEAIERMINDSKTIRLRIEDVLQPAPTS